MGLFTSDLDKDLDEARKHVVATERVCPTCNQPYTTTGDTLTQINRALGMEVHKCPKCGGEVWIRPAPPTG